MPVNRSDYQFGVMYRRHYAPETLKPFVQRAESAGLDEVWVVEDCFFGGGIALATSALAFSERIAVGLGIMPAVARNAAFTAMEVALLAKLYPGRFLPGLGHGVGDWMRQIGAFPKSQLQALEEVTLTLRRLLRGELVTVEGQQVNIKDVQLVFPPEVVPPVSLGVRGPKSLQLAGRSADGTLLAEFASPAYVRWAREQIAQGQRAVERSDPHRLTVYMWSAVDVDGQAARQSLRPLIGEYLRLEKNGPYVRALGIEQDVTDLLDKLGSEQFTAEFPDEWIDQMAVVGTPDECAAAIQALVEAGANSVVLVPTQGEDVAAVDRIAELIVPRL